MQTAVCSESRKIVSRKMEVSNNKGGKAKLEVLKFQEESEDLEKGFGTKLYNKLKPETCRPSTLPGAEKLIEEFARIATDEVNSLILQKDKRKHSDLDKKLLKLFEVINNERNWTVAQTDKTNNWVPIRVDYYFKKMIENMEKTASK